MGRMQDVSVTGDFLGFKLKGEMVVVFFSQYIMASMWHIFLSEYHLRHLKQNQNSLPFKMFSYLFFQSIAFSSSSRLNSITTPHEQSALAEITCGDQECVPFSPEDVYVFPELGCGCENGAFCPFIRSVHCYLPSFESRCFINIC